MMAYQNNFVISIIHAGKPIREFAENNQRTCAIPFGSEYKIRIKNKTSKRAKAKVYIDGMDTLSNGGYFILAANQTLDLERFVDDLSDGRKFKFISIEQGMATGEIQDPTSQDNGRIKVEFFPEDDSYSQLARALEEHRRQEERNRSPYVWTCTNGPTLSKGLTSNSVNVNGTLSSTTASNSISTASYSTDSLVSTDIANAAVTAFNTAGATVEGGISKQAFIATTADFRTLSPTIIELKLRGPVLEAPAPTRGVEVIFQTGGVIAVRMNGQPFVKSSDYGVKISLSDKGLSISGKGVDIETQQYKVVAE